jgi:hypothetical protein
VSRESSVDIGTVFRALLPAIVFVVPTSLIWAGILSGVLPENSQNPVYAAFAMFMFWGPFLVPLLAPFYLYRFAKQLNDARRQSATGKIKLMSPGWLTFILFLVNLLVGFGGCAGAIFFNAFNFYQS